MILEEEGTGELALAHGAAICVVLYPLPLAALQLTAAALPIALPCQAL
jgi:hypothetical protein